MLVDLVERLCLIVPQKDRQQKTTPKTTRPAPRCALGGAD